jgi:hypothetical protein
MKMMDDKDKKRFGVKLTTPPTFGFPNRPIEPIGEPPPRSGQRCENCNAFAIIPHPVFGKQAVCRAEPVKPIYLGMSQTQTVNAQGQPGQFPYIIGQQAPTLPENWCRVWEWVGPDGGNK